MKKICLLGLFILVMIIFAQSFVWAQPKSIKIGWSGPLTGPAAEVGAASRAASILAMEEWNAKGGIHIAEAQKKLPVEILFEDSQSKVEVGVSLGEKLLGRDKVNFLISDAFHSSISMAVMELAPKYNIPIICGGTSDEISKKIVSNPERYKFFWKDIFGSTSEAKGAFDLYQDFIGQKAFIPKTKTISVMGEDSDFSRAHAAATKENFEKIGWRYLGMEAVPMGHTDFYPQLNKMKNLSPDILLYSFASLSSGAAATKQFHEIGVKSSLFLIYLPNVPEFIPQTGKAAEYLLWLPLHMTPERPGVPEFLEKISKRWPERKAMDDNHVWGYEHMNTVLDAIQRAGSLEPEKIVDALSKMDRKGLYGRYTFDVLTHTLKSGNEFIPMPAAQIVEGKSSVISPAYLAKKKYVPQPWTK